VSYVIDASVAVKWFIWEEGTEEAQELLDQLITFYVPDLFLMEIDSILTKKVRRNELATSDAFQKRKIFRELPYKLIAYKQLDEFAFRLATEFPITMYDAAYLATAVDYDATLHTADKRLVNGMSNTPFSDHICRLKY
jgi:predicted nucleic acid-binding protein